MPTRVDFWGIPIGWGSGLVYGICFAASLYFLWRFYQEASLWFKVGRRERSTGSPWRRLWQVAKYYFAQARVLRQTYAGIMHAAIFWSFIVFFLGTALATINGHFFTILVGPVYLAYKLVLDLSILVFLVGAGMAAYRRYILKPVKLTFDTRFDQSLALISAIVILGPFIESFRLAVVSLTNEQPALSAAPWSPIGWGLARLWLAMGATQASLMAWHTGVYVAHLLLVALFFVALPTGTLLHIMTAGFNIYLSNIDQPVGRLAAAATGAQGEYLYADKLRNLTWKQLLNSDTCTECGRCEDACPAHAAGRPLSPKQVMLSLRTAFRTEAARVMKDQPELKPLVGGYIADEALWSCTTCGACVNECPVLIDHLDTIVDMRRYLVSESRVDELLQTALANLGRYGNSFGQSDRARAKWAMPAPGAAKIKDARKEEVEYLWFVGDYASFNPTVVETTKALASILQQAGVDFGLLYEAERNSGNDVRRVGEEGLFEMLVEKNSAAFAKAKFKAVLTTDPHTLNTLRNEYPAEALGGRPVVHYAELLDQLISSGKLKLSKKLGYQVTYHDPCYLGRYNGIYDAPRRVIEACGCTLVEMPRNHEHSFCCNAGGGQIWMKEGEMPGGRPSESRIKEAAALPGVGVFVVACPKDLTMYKDAVKTTSMEAKLSVKDLVELVSEAM